MGNLLDDPITITGLGLATGFGLTGTWESILAGKSAVRWLNLDYPSGAYDPVTRADRPSLFSGATCTQWDTEPSTFETPSIVKMREFVAAAAMEEAQLQDVDPDRIGTVFGTSKGDLHSFDAAARVSHDQLTTHERRQLAKQPGEYWKPLFWKSWQPNESARTVHQIAGAKGPCLCPVAACATGLIALIRGVQLINEGACDVVLAGAADSSVNKMLLPSYQRLGVLANGFTDPADAGRPMDRNRRGFLVGEGAAAFVLERSRHAEARRVRHRYANLLAGGMVGDASGLTRLDEDGESVSYVISDVLRRGSMDAKEIDYINLHGTGTRMNDAVEATAVSREFTGHADNLICSAQKGALGHTMGAAGAVETALTLLAMRDQVVPPTRNLLAPDEKCHFELARNKPIQHDIRRAMKLSLGFGGHIAAALFERP